MTFADQLDANGASYVFRDVLCSARNEEIDDAPLVIRHDLVHQAYLASSSQSQSKPATAAPARVISQDQIVEDLLA